MKLTEITSFLESVAPQSLQESYDNSGLIVDNGLTNVNQALITIDCTQEVVDEAINRQCDLIIAHHPIVFTGIKSFDRSNYIHETIIKAIKNNISIFAIHTNLDNVSNGVNGAIASKLGLERTKVLRYKKGQMKKINVYVPTEFEQSVKDSMWEAGGGNIGNYSKCSFNTHGVGTFCGNDDSQPSYGQKNKLHHEKESKIEMVFPAYLERNITTKMLETHPYEEVSYDIFTLENHHIGIGSGMIGYLPNPMNTEDFLKHLKKVMKTEVIRHTKMLNQPISKVALCGGSGSFLLSDAISKEADIFISADFKYHQFFDANNKIVIADIGHFESEQFTKELIYDLLKKKFTKFATHLSRVNTNPINYLK
ncbi:MAG: Nif3-like dinuclear metal center hexameric protein [Bacteroidota bacterium]|nr:Nif3-like dinuclear metal center hexameric protein [Bacteroidota bacterium]